MSKSTRNSGKEWTKGDESNLKDLAKHNTPTRVIGLKLEGQKIQLEVKQVI
jgi:hypothetical protein